MTPAEFAMSCLAWTNPHDHRSITDGDATISELTSAALAEYNAAIPAANEVVDKCATGAEITDDDAKAYNVRVAADRRYVILALVDLIVHHAPRIKERIPYDKRHEAGASDSARSEVETAINLLRKHTAKFGFDRVAKARVTMPLPTRMLPPPIGPQQVVPDYQFRAPIDPALLPDLIRLEAARDAAKDAREAYRLTAPLDADGYRTAAADAELDRLEVAEIAADNAFYALSEPSRTPRVHQKMSMNW